MHKATSCRYLLNLGIKLLLQKFDANLAISTEPPLSEPPLSSSYFTHCTVNNATKSGFVPSVSHIPVRVSERLDFSKWIVPRNDSSAVCTRNLHNLITIPTVPDQANVPHKLGLSEYSQGRHIPTRLTTARNDSRWKTHQSRNLNNTINIGTDRRAPKTTSCVRFAVWNAHSINKKSASICDFVMSRRLDILVLTETWLSTKSSDSNTVAEITHTLQDHNFIHLPRSDRKGGGVGILLKKGFGIRENILSKFRSMEYLDLSLTSNKLTFRLVAVYRPPPSKKNKLTTSIFFDEFSTLLEDLTVTPGYLLVVGDFNFHMDIASDTDSSRFTDLLESAGLQQRVTGPTHRCGHTLDLIIDRREESLLLPGVHSVSDLPSDHYAVTGSLYLQRPRATKKIIKHRNLRRIDQQSWREDLESLRCCSTPDLNSITDHFNNVLREILDKL